MTLRAWTIGLLGVVFVCTYTYVNDAIMHQTMFVGNNMPLSVYGGLILLILILNPVLRKLHQRLAFTGREIAVMLTLVLAACVIPGSGLLRTFTSSLLLPHKFEKTEPGWKEENVINLVPERMLADVEGNENVVLNGYLQGLGSAKESISFSDVPWDAWAGALSFWLPIILLVWIGLIGLSLMFHRQWADHEHLPYPIAHFANALLPDQGGIRSSIVGNRIFWMGLLGVLVIHLNNYAYVWFPKVLIEIPRDLNFLSLSQQFPLLNKGGGGFIWRPTLIFTVIAFAYFLSSDVSLSLGVAPYLYALVAGICVSYYGFSLSGGGMLTLKVSTFMNFGCYTGMLIAILFTGRHYYWNTLKHAVFLPAQEKVDGSSVWGLRAYMVTLISFVFAVMALGLDWQLAVIYFVGMTIIFVVMGRIIAETGLFFIQPYAFPCILIWGVFGAQALGPSTLALLLMLSAVLLIDPREALMPFVINNLKVTDLRKIKPGKAALGFGLAVILGLAVAVPTTLYFQYNRGANLSDAWATNSVPAMPFNTATRVKQQLKAQELLESSQAASGFERFTMMSPYSPGMIGFAVGLVLVGIFAFGRLRFPKWPLHPVLFLVWSSYPAQSFAFSFLIGWMLKVLVSKYGGANVYQRLKPFMFGLIAGDMLGGVFPSIIGFIYWTLTDKLPQGFSIMPG